MMIRTLAAIALLASSAWAQTEPAAEAPAQATEATTEAAAAPVTEPAAPPTIPTDPMELAAFALAHAREPAQCRYAFSRMSTTAAQVAWSDAEAELVVRFDPRLPIGERWVVEQASRQQRAIERSFAREDRKGLPFDLIGLMAEGEWTFENLAFVRELPDRYVYSYTPAIIPERSASETGEGIIEQLVGELEVSRETGHIISSTLREPPEEAVRAMGIVRVRRALLRSAYAPSANNYHLTDSGSQMMSMSALLTNTEVTTSFRMTNIEAICDPAEVARIVEAETAAAAARRD